MKTICFHSPKTAGNTLTTINLALCYQLQQPQARVGYWQCTRYPDAHHYLGLTAPTQTSFQLAAFWGANEWSPDLLKPLIQNQIIDFIPGPQGAEWEDIDLPLWKGMSNLVSQAYDVLFIDLGRDIPETHRAHIITTAESLVTTICLDPLSLQTLTKFNQQYPDATKKQHLIINQAPQEAAALVKKELPHQHQRIIGYLPLAQKGLWDQVYKGLPIALQKRTNWKKPLQQITTALVKN